MIDFFPFQLIKNKGDKMNLNQISYLLFKRIKFIIAVPLLVSFITLIASLTLIEPVYKTTTTLYIINKSEAQKSINYEDILTNQQLVKDYRELIKSRNVTKAALEDLNIKDLSHDQLAKKISVSLKTDTRVLQISVEDKNPKKAMDLTNKVSEKFIEKSVSLMSVDNINVVDTAELPKIPEKPKPLTYTVLALFLSLILTLGAIYFLEYFNDRIKSKEDIEEYLSISVLGTIPLVKTNK